MKKPTEAEYIEGLCSSITELQHQVLVRKVGQMVAYAREQLDIRDAKAKKTRERRVADARSFLAAFPAERFGGLNNDEPWPCRGDLAHALEHIEDLCREIEKL